MRRLLLIATMILGSIALLSRASFAQQPSEANMAILGYIAGMISTHYCACDRWPSSWAEFKDFDDKWRAHSRSQGHGGNATSIPWSRLAQSSTAVAPEGQLAVSIRGLTADPIEIGVPHPDCSDFHPEVVVHLCSERDE